MENPSWMERNQLKKKGLERLQQVRRRRII